MDRRRLRWVLRLAAVLVAGLGVWIFVQWQKEQNRVAIENRTGQPIPRLEMSAEGQSVTLENVPPGAVIPIPGSGDGKFPLQVSGQTSEGQIRWRGIPPEGNHLYILPGGMIDVHRPGRDGKR